MKCSGCRQAIQFNWGVDSGTVKLVCLASSSKGSYINFNGGLVVLINYLKSMKPFDVLRMLLYEFIKKILSPHHLQGTSQVLS